MAVRSCAVGGATTPCASNVSPSVSASSSGAALWSAKTARTWWTYTPASPTSDPIGWTKPNKETRPITTTDSLTCALLAALYYGIYNWDLLTVIPLAFDPFTLPEAETSQTFIE